MTKIEQRCTKYGPALKKMSLGKRILVFNVFIFSMLTYLSFYFPIPYAERGGLAPSKGSTTWSRATSSTTSPATLLRSLPPH